MPANILVTGGAGQLANEIEFLVTNNYLEEQEIIGDFYFTDRKTLDINNQALVKAFCKDKAITTIVNCAAYTAVDKAETESEQAYQVNHFAVGKLATVAKELAIGLIHISTDYVYDGAKREPYLESNLPNPQCVYGKSKLAGEMLMQEINPAKSIIIRTSWLYSSFGKNFVKTMLKLASEGKALNVVADQIGTPTSARSLALAILKIIPKLHNETVKIYHYSNEGFCSWYNFTTTIFELSGVSCQVNPITTKDYPTAAPRPLYTVLDKQSFKNDFQQDIMHWHEALRLQIHEFEV